jgi:hypothetical protein
MSWVVRRIGVTGDDDEYVHKFARAHVRPSKEPPWAPRDVEWTKVQTMAHRFSDRSDAVYLADYVDSSARPVRLVRRGLLEHERARVAQRDLAIAEQDKLITIAINELGLAMAPDPIAALRALGSADPDATTHPIGTGET